MFCFPLVLWNLERTEYAPLCFSDARNDLSPFISAQPPLIVDILDVTYQVASVVSDSLLPYGPKPTRLLCPHGQQPAKLLCPWGSSGKKKYWSGLLCPPPGDLPNPGTEPLSFMSPALAEGFFTYQHHLGSPCVYTRCMYLCVCVCVYHPTCQTLYIIARLYCHMEFVI